MKCTLYPYNIVPPTQSYEVGHQCQIVNCQIIAICHFSNSILNSYLDSGLREEGGASRVDRMWLYLAVHCCRYPTDVAADLPQNSIEDIELLSDAALSSSDPFDSLRSPLGSKECDCRIIPCCCNQPHHQPPLLLDQIRTKGAN